MTGETVDCYNCGRANPAWAQVCRSCGVPIRPGMGASASQGPIPRDRDSLLSMAIGLAAIVGAIATPTRAPRARAGQAVGMLPALCATSRSGGTSGRRGSGIERWYVSS